jgi:hypothetical protein
VKCYGSKQGAEEIMSTQKEGVNAGRRKVHDDALHNSYSSSNIFKVIRTSTMRRVGLKACVRGETYRTFLLDNYLENLNIVRRTALTWT